MFNFGFWKSEPTFAIGRLTSGRFAIVNNKTGDVVNTYTRQRDAVRGAERAGLKLA